MSICVVGGGLGRQLIRTLAGNHDVTGIYPTLPEVAPNGVSVALYEAATADGGAVGAAEVVVHAALDTGAKRSAFTSQTGR